MIGLGVGIDYALFLITRHQEQLRAGMEMSESIARAVATSGSAIVFAGATVVDRAAVARRSPASRWSAPSVWRPPRPSSPPCSAAITLLPALLGLLEHRIHWLALPAFLRPEAEARAPACGRRWAGSYAAAAVVAVAVAGRPRRR